ncbi:MAG TPA: isocitrate lyase/phosphoenolpyruvate mutase family protein [Pyrinomonadaceae bacterium]|nr:isocitrate lyase/phosphoenolpyruvate mutase family protein [Pyrinomonadaceae bacterium]
MELQKEKAIRLAELHRAGSPMVLFNIWDAGSAKAVADAGAKAIATGSWSVAAANGFADGEYVPLGLVLENIERIVRAVDLPVTLDFEGGYSVDVDELKENIYKVLDSGAVGINFEDQIVRADGLYSVVEQARRIAAIREAADQRDIPLFINARTDIFLKNALATHADHLSEALDRAVAYAEAGASGFFALGLSDPALIAALCRASPLPVNILAMPDTLTNLELASLGVARISYGSGPYRQMAKALAIAARRAFGSRSG